MSRNIKLLLLALLIIASGIFYVWKRNKIDMMIENLTILESKEHELIAQNREINIDLERLSRSERIQKIAKEQLNMYIPDPETLAVKLDKEL